MQYRDTDRDWEMMAKANPYFAVLTEPKYNASELTPEATEEFFRTGELHVAGVLAMIRAHFDRQYQPEVCVDFGCGVGRVLIPLARHCRTAVGVDISEAMLALARSNARARSVSNVQLVHSDEELSEVPSGYDFLNSVIVFQHIPPPRGCVLLRTLLGKLRNGGYFYVHLTFAKDRRFLDHAMRHVQVWRSEEASISVLAAAPPVEGAVMSMYDYDLNTIFLLLMQAGVAGMFVHFTDHGGCYGVIICGRKGSGE